MKTFTLSSLLILVFSLSNWSNQRTIGAGSLAITLQISASGTELTSIQNNGMELLEEESSLFSLFITRLSNNSDEIITSAAGWGNVNVSSVGSNYTVVLSNPSNVNLPNSLTATATINVIGSQSQWDLAVTGLGADHTLTSVEIPELKLHAPGNDAFLVPRYSGQVIPNPIDPLGESIDYESIYPRGWSATLPFLAYYNDNYGIYFGYHDPAASVKRFFVTAEGSYVKFHAAISVPDRSIADNNWELPGVFELDLYDGDWYDAAMIYKTWSEAEADYWPQMTPERIARQNEIGRIGVWGYLSEAVYPMASIEKDINTYRNYFAGTPVGIHWYQWNGSAVDNDYPEYFPERAGMSELVGRIQQSGDAYIMPYINGRLYDTDLANYSTDGFPYATKNSSNIAYTQPFQGNVFAVMCPTQAPWQDILVDASDQLTDRIGTSAIYIDQVAAASPKECMDPTHNHPLGEGHNWRDGYNSMFEKIHAEIPAGKFVTVEGGTDYLADEVDGFLTIGWRTNNLVPAFQAIYGGRVQFFGRATGTSNYHNQSFYTKLSQAFVHGIQPGRTSLWIVSDANADLAAPFVRKLATMRYKLRDYLSFGQVLKPIEVNESMPEITSVWVRNLDGSVAEEVTISAIQTGRFREKDNGAVAVIFANASMTDTLSFSFDFAGNLYGLVGDLSRREITATTDGAAVTVDNQFTHAVTLAPMEVVAFEVDTIGIPTVVELDSVSAETLSPLTIFLFIMLPLSTFLIFAKYALARH